MTSLTDGDATSVRAQRLVMVVDDNVRRRQQLREALTRHDLTVHCVSSATHALDIYQAVKPRVVIVATPNASTTNGTFLSHLSALTPPPAIIMMGNGHHPLPNGMSVVVPEAAPVEQVAAEAARLAAAGDTALAHSRATILLVDDEPKWRQILKEFLELHGFLTAAAGTGEEALTYLAREQPKVLVLDIRMPGMDGLLTLKHIRIYHPHLPVVIVSQSDEERVREEAGILGVCDYLVKPLNLEELRRVLQHHLGEPPRQ